MNRILFAFLIGLTVLPRLIFLDSVPYSASHDEVEYAMNSLSYAVRGTDTSGVGFPRSLFVTFTEGVISPLPPLLLAPWYYVFGVSEWAMNLPYVLINILTAWLLYLLTKRLTDHKEIGWAAAFFFLISPWGFFYSRYSVDSPFALLFVLFGISYFIFGKRNRVLIVALTMIAMFYAYHASKLLYVPLIGLLVGWHYFYGQKRYKIREYAMHILVALIVICSYYAISLMLPDSMIKVRESHALVFTSEEVATSARIMRERSLAFTPVNQLMINNVTVGLAVMVGKYLHAFSPDVLLVSGDMRAAYRFYEYGLLYLIQGVFVLYGFLRLYVKRRDIFCLTLGLLLLAPLPTAVSTVETSVIHRAFLMLVALAVVGGYGMYELDKLVSGKAAAIPANLLLYGLSIMHFLFFVHFYFMSYGFRYPDSVFTFNKPVAYYALLEDSRKVEVVVPEQRSMFYSVMAFSPRDQQIEMLRTQPPTRFDEKGGFEFGNLRVTNVCPSARDDATTYVVRHDFLTCGLADEGIAIKDPRDAAPMFKIMGDRVCSDVELMQWRSPSYLSDFDYAGMSKEEFCRRWISDRT